MNLKLCNDLLIIRNLSPNDNISLIDYRNRSEVSRYQSWSSFSENDFKQLLIDEVGNDLTSGKWQQFAILIKDSQTVIGDIGIQFSFPKLKIGYTLNPQYWGNGYATKALYLIEEWAKTNGFKIIAAETDPRNTASIKLLQRLNYTFIKKIEKSAFLKNEWVDDLCYEKNLAPRL